MQQGTEKILKFDVALKVVPSFLKDIAGSKCHHGKDLQRHLPLILRSSQLYVCGVIISATRFWK